MVPPPVGFDFAEKFRPGIASANHQEVVREFTPVTTSLFGRLGDSDSPAIESTAPGEAGPLLKFSRESSRETMLKNSGNSSESQQMLRFNLPQNLISGVIFKRVGAKTRPPK